MVQVCLEAADELIKDGIEVEVVDIRTLLPLDTKTIIDSVIKTKHVLIVHEAVQFAGFGGEIAGQIADSEAFYHLEAPIRRIGAKSTPIPFNPTLERETFPTVQKIVAQVKDLV
jgi:pyruvate dehydrogenase E1 component beta subunit